MSIRSALAASIAASALLASGCGDTCPTETVARIQRVESCTVAPGSPVSIGVEPCPTCNQTGTSCEVDVSGAGQGDIQLDPVAEACESVSSCGSLAPACQAQPLECRFTAPTAPGSYRLLVFDPSTVSFRQRGTLTVSITEPQSCAFALGAE
jgi:hypothetical protein